MVNFGSYNIGKKLKLKHNLDVMHIEKNICENLIETILNINGKTKDMLKARLDLKDLGIKKKIQFRDDGYSCEKIPAFHPSVVAGQVRHAER
jgi:hypothetical protein